jgi:hypothetical protein
LDHPERQGPEFHGTKRRIVFCAGVLNTWNRSHRGIFSKTHLSL